jgi:hypothetical protein
MLSRTPQRRHRNSPRPAEKSAPGFLKFVRGYECAFQGIGKCEGKVEAMHLDWAGGKGTGSKVADRFVIPGCSGHARRQHNKGWETFMREMNATRESLLLMADYLWKHWPGRIAFEKKLADGTLPKLPRLTDKDYRGGF